VRFTATVKNLTVPPLTSGRAIPRPAAERRTNRDIWQPNSVLKGYFCSLDITRYQDRTPPTRHVVTLSIVLFTLDEITSHMCPCARACICTVFFFLR